MKSKNRISAGFRSSKSLYIEKHSVNLKTGKEQNRAISTSRIIQQNKNKQKQQTKKTIKQKRIR